MVLRRYAVFASWWGAFAAWGAQDFSPANSNWAVIVDTSRYWYNYRHAANSLSFYRTVKRLGIPDSQIILMLADDYACNSRNKYPGTVYNDQSQGFNLYGEDAEVDYRTDDTSVDAFLRLLTGRQERWTPRSKRLLTDDQSNIFIFMTGHGGDGFLKFQDWEEINSQDIADAFLQMAKQKRFRQLLFVADTCQAATLADAFRTPGTIAIGSSLKDQNSWSHHVDEDIGIPIIDRFTYASLQFFEAMTPTSNVTISEYVKYLTFGRLHSDVSARDDVGGARLKESRVVDFLGSSGASNVEFLEPFSVGA